MDTWETLEEDEDEDSGKTTKINRKSSITNSIRNKLTKVKQKFNGTLVRAGSLTNLAKPETGKRQRKISAEVTRPKLSELYEKQDFTFNRLHRKSLSEGELNITLPQKTVSTENFSNQANSYFDQTGVKPINKELTFGENIYRSSVARLQIHNNIEISDNLKNMDVEKHLLESNALKKAIHEKIENVIHQDLNKDIFKISKDLVKRIRDELIDVTKDTNKILVSITSTEKKTCANVSISSKGDIENDILYVQLFEDEISYFWVTVLLSKREQCL